MTKVEVHGYEVPDVVVSAFKREFLNREQFKQKEVSSWLINTSVPDLYPGLPGIRGFRGTVASALIQSVRSKISRKPKSEERKYGVVYQVRKDWL